MKKDSKTQMTDIYQFNVTSKIGLQSDTHMGIPSKNRIRQEVSRQRMAICMTVVQK